MVANFYTILVKPVQQHALIRQQCAVRPVVITVVMMMVMIGEGLVG